MFLIWLKPRITIPTFFDYIVGKHGVQEAVVFSQFSIRWTYSQLFEKCDEFAAGLLALGLYKGDRVGIWSPNRPEWIIAQIATARLGIILVNINPAYKQLELEYCINKVDLKCLIFATQFKTSSYAEMIKALCPELTTQRVGNLKLKRLPSLRSLVQVSSEPMSGAYSFQEVAARGTEGYRDRLNAISSCLKPDEPINI